MDITQFSLKKAKVMKNGGLEIEFDVHETVGASHYVDSKNVKSSKFIHPDLEALFLQFKPYLSSNMGYDQIRKVVNNPEFGATDEQKMFAEKQYQYMLEKIEIIGISIASDSNSLKIIGKNVLNGTPISINSTNLRFDTKHGYEEDIQALSKTLKEEVYAFLYEDKTANPEIPFDENEANPEDLPEDEDEDE